MGKRMLAVFGVGGATNPFWRIAQTWPVTPVSIDEWR
jgi:hypothetical protein